TIPGVLAHHKETVLKTGLKKAQAVLSSALELMIYETGVIPNYKNYTNNSFFPVFKTYLSGLKDFCENTRCSSYNIPDELQDVYHTYNDRSDIEQLRFDEGQAILSDGMLLMVQNTSAVDGIIFLTMDINGYGNKPNKWGHDLFTFQIDPETGELIPMGHPNAYYNSSSYCSKTGTSTINGISCTYPALTEKDYFKNLP
ncbi:MAG: hypothetical protein LUE64_05950, partial [Candidatus Gastranaerophilales bacterium]|nr:hypothetical protein [Candidatus Gastranaerophilales bacterium]